MAKKEYFGKTDLLLLVQLIYAEVNKYVLKVDGKGLSEEDFTTALKTKLEGIDLSLYATLESPAFSGTPTVPTATEGTESLQIANTTFVLKAIADAIKDIAGIEITKVDSYEDLPEVGRKGTIYLVPKDKTTTTTDVYDEYFWDGTRYEFMGSTAIDLSNYLQITDVVEMSTDEVQATWDSVFGS